MGESTGLHQRGIDDPLLDGNTLATVRELLQSPWTAREASLLMEDGAYIAVLSANKGRLVIREWLQTSPDKLRRNLSWFFDAQRVQGPEGEDPRSFGLRQLVEPLEAQTIDAKTGRIKSRTPVEPNLIRSLLRAAYSDHPPPLQLRARAVNMLQNPSVWAVPWLIHRTVALLTLAQVDYRQLQQMNATQNRDTERLDTEQTSAAYRCGRLLAVIEDAQLQAHGWNLNRTIVDRNFTAGSAGLRDYRPVVVQDALGFIKEDHREYAVEHANWLFGETIDRTDIEFS